MNSFPEIATLIEQIDTAYSWVCKQRKHAPANADIWHLRFHWAEKRTRLIDALHAGTYHFEPMQLIIKRSGVSVVMWSAQDALVLKAVTMLLENYLPIDRHCTHVKNHGGAKQTVTDLYQAIPANQFVLRTDVKAYYASIDHHLLLNRVAFYINDAFILNLLWQYCARITDKGGIFLHHSRGIPRGCPLSPLIGAFFLRELDEAMVATGLFYRRYMDDVILLAPTRWKLRRAVKRLNDYFSVLGLKKHPDKTFIGRIEKGFDFLGYQFGHGKLTVSARSLDNHQRRYARLYEQEKHRHDLPVFLESYRQRWIQWVKAGLPSVMLNLEHLYQLNSITAVDVAIPIQLIQRQTI